MKSPLEWSSYERNQSLANRTEKQVELEGRKGFDTQELSSDRDEENEGHEHTIWKHDKLTDQNLYVLNEKLAQQQEKGRVEIEEAEKQYKDLMAEYQSMQKKFPELVHNITKEFASKLDQYKKLDEEEKSLIDRNNNLVTEMDQVQGVLDGTTAWEKVFDRNEVLKVVEEDARLREILGARKRLYGLLRNISLGLIRVDPEKQLLDYAARELAWKKTEDITKEYDTIHQTLLELQNEMRHINEWAEEQRAHPEFETVHDLVQSINKETTILNRSKMN